MSGLKKKKKTHTNRTNGRLYTREKSISDCEGTAIDTL